MTWSSWDGCARVYSRKQSLDQRPQAWMSHSRTPFIAAVVAAPIRKLWAEYCWAKGTPATFRHFRSVSCPRTGCALEGFRTLARGRPIWAKRRDGLPKKHHSSLHYQSWLSGGEREKEWRKQREVAWFMATEPRTIWPLLKLVFYAGGLKPKSHLCSAKRKNDMKPGIRYNCWKSAQSRNVAPSFNGSS